MRPIGRLVIIFTVITLGLVLDGNWFKYIYTSNKAVTPICILYIRIPSIKKLRFLKYKSSSSLQASVFNGDGEV
jgi:hypothetical protein